MKEEEILELGWTNPKKAVCTWYEAEGIFQDGFASYGYWTKLRLLSCSDNKFKIMAYEYSWEEKETTLFQGVVENREDFKKLMKQLNILQ